jgi:hypothetical protein
MDLVSKDKVGEIIKDLIAIQTRVGGNNQVNKGRVGAIKILIKDKIGVTNILTKDNGDNKIKDGATKTQIKAKVKGGEIKFLIKVKIGEIKFLTKVKDGTIKDGEMVRLQVGEIKDFQEILGEQQIHTIGTILMV